MENFTYYVEGIWIFERLESPVTGALNLLIYVSCRITFPETSSSSKKRKHDEDEPKEVNQELLVEPFVVPNRGPYPFNQPKKYMNLFVLVFVASYISNTERDCFTTFSNSEIRRTTEYF